MKHTAAPHVGFTLLELVVVICLIGIFASVALDRMLRYQEIAEKTAMDSTIGALKSAETLQVAAHITGGGLASVAKLAEENPIDWLAAPPAGYLGALQDPGGANIPGGSWYFDIKNKELVYVPQRTRFLTPAPDGSLRVRFRVVVKLVRTGDDGPIIGLTELDVRPVFPVRWSPSF